MIPLLKAIPRSLGLLGDHELAIGYNVWFYALNKLRGFFLFFKRTYTDKSNLYENKHQNKT
jgi:hypothetical protein